LQENLGRREEKMETRRDRARQEGGVGARAECWYGLGTGWVPGLVGRGRKVVGGSLWFSSVGLTDASIRSGYWLPANKPKPKGGGPQNGLTALTRCLRPQRLDWPQPGNCHSISSLSALCLCPGKSADWGAGPTSPLTSFGPSAKPGRPGPWVALCSAS